VLFKAELDLVVQIDLVHQVHQRVRGKQPLGEL